MTGREVSSADVSVSGDAELAGELARLAGKLRWDGAEDLSRLVGDMAAERLARSARLALGLKGEIAARLGMSLIEHWREEAPLLMRMSSVSATRWTSCATLLPACKSGWNACRKPFCRPA